MELAAALKDGCSQPARRQNAVALNNGVSMDKKVSWTVSQVLLATNGRFVSGETETAFRAISTDTRTLKPGDLFVALSGDRFDGQHFLEEAVKKGAAGLVVSVIPKKKMPVAVVEVPDTLKALGDLAAYRRRLMGNLLVIAITGSSGKTTVKEMCAVILAQKFAILKTEGNLNNLIGMPLSLLPVENKHDIAILEMGMNRPGEIARMTAIANPDIACIVNVQDAHLAGLDSIEGVARAKGELFERGKSWARFCVNIDDKRVKKLAAERSQKQISFGKNRNADVRATHVRNEGEFGMAFTLHINHKKERIHIRSLGEHNVTNALAAAAMSYAAGADFDTIVKGLEKFEPYDKRLKIEKIAGLRVVNDCYNANPSSMCAALKTVQAMNKGNKAVAVLGDMLELGDSSVKAHRQLGETVAITGFNSLFVVGEFSRKVVEGALDARMTINQARQVNSNDEVIDALVEMVHLGELNEGDWILVKGSRGMRMETVIEGLKKQLEMES
ncbi:MAG: UDP-N-acetylmuramoyl-tripeptide--D-alanyl-D-alanine ligase [Desulfobulbaceae bacterium]|uniref:UDP-N-acetylmuramoyl-tripeptide--D-alanyl-D-alanine ligase n=1 Tax=Candidatus Desulfobia pelagia TaxID=2841692 RepID=A0A8J6NF85_9BACT|nr:UDP-N-acetylmuramoyl-tripeptide--D-alanyl-D-alanine ligase [Candidatus Desulfobia pelagia]